MSVLPKDFILVGCLACFYSRHNSNDITAYYARDIIILERVFIHDNHDNCFCFVSLFLLLLFFFSIVEDVLPLRHIKLIQLVSHGSVMMHAGEWNYDIHL